jgi:hypothetical protein
VLRRAARPATDSLSLSLTRVEMRFETKGAAQGHASAAVLMVVVGTGTGHPYGDKPFTRTGAGASAAVALPPPAAPTGAVESAAPAVAPPHVLLLRRHLHERRRHRGRERWQRRLLVLALQRLVTQSFFFGDVSASLQTKQGSAPSSSGGNFLLASCYIAMASS